MNYHSSHKQLLPCCKIKELKVVNSYIYLCRLYQSRFYGIKWISFSIFNWTKRKKALRETQTLRAGCSKVKPNIFTPPQTRFPVAQDGQNLMSLRWSLPSPTNPVWWGSMHTIFQIIVATDPQTHTHKQTYRQDRLQYTATLSLACSGTRMTGT